MKLARDLPTDVSQSFDWGAKVDYGVDGSDDECLVHVSSFNSLCF